MNKKYIVLMDFDGTISTVDVGDQIIYKFIKVKGAEQLAEDFRTKTIGSTELYTKLYAGFNGSKEEVISFVKTFSLDPYFKNFISFCNINNIKTAVLSDGFDFYINALFDKYDIGPLTIYCNNGYFKNQSIELEFPYQNPYCHICANCKASAYLKYKDAGYNVIFIGDGYSDRYVAEKADIVFAKSHLIDYCKANSIEYIPFNTFNDVKKSLSAKLSL